MKAFLHNTSSSSSPLQTSGTATSQTNKLENKLAMTQSHHNNNNNNTKVTPSEIFYHRRFFYTPPISNKLYMQKIQCKNAKFKRLDIGTSEIFEYVRLKYPQKHLYAITSFELDITNKIMIENIKSLKSLSSLKFRIANKFKEKNKHKFKDDFTRRIPSNLTSLTIPHNSIQVLNCDIVPKRIRYIFNPLPRITLLCLSFCVFRENSSCIKVINRFLGNHKEFLHQRQIVIQVIDSKCIESLQEICDRFNPSIPKSQLVSRTPKVLFHIIPHAYYIRANTVFEDPDKENHMIQNSNTKSDDLYKMYKASLINYCISADTQTILWNKYYDVIQPNRMNNNDFPFLQTLRICFVKFSNHHFPAVSKFENILRQISPKLKHLDVLMKIDNTWKHMFPVIEAAIPHMTSLQRLKIHDLNDTINEQSLMNIFGLASDFSVMFPQYNSNCSYIRHINIRAIIQFKFLFDVLSSSDRLMLSSLKLRDLYLTKNSDDKFDIDDPSFVGQHARFEGFMQTRGSNLTVFKLHINHICIRNLDSIIQSCSKLPKLESLEFDVDKISYHPKLDRQYRNFCRNFPVFRALKFLDIREAELEFKNDGRKSIQRFFDNLRKTLTLENVFYRQSPIMTREFLVEAAKPDDSYGYGFALVNKLVNQFTQEVAVCWCTDKILRFF